MARPRDTTYDNQIRRLVIEGMNARNIYMFLNINARSQGKADVISYPSVWRRYKDYVKIYRPWEDELLPHEELFRTKSRKDQ